MHGKDVAAVLLPAGDGELAHAHVEQLDAAVAAGGQELVRMLLRPRQVEQTVLGLEELVADDSIGCQAEDERRPLPTRPKLVPPPNAMRLSKNGEYLTL